MHILVRLASQLLAKDVLGILRFHWHYNKDWFREEKKVTNYPHHNCL